MRYYSFLALASIALFLDLLLFGLGFTQPALRLRFSGPTTALADSHSTTRPLALAPTARSRPAARVLRPTRTPLPTGVPSPTPSPTPTVTPTSTPPPTATPTPPPQIVASGSAAFTEHNRAVRANIRLALSHYGGALTHIVVPPGGLFSFNAALGLDPERLPWKTVIAELPPDPNAEAAPDGSVPAAPLSKSVRGGGLCDLASRYVMAARPLLPSRAFHFVNHVRSTGIYLNGVPVRDSVSIWAVGGRAGEQDLLITNVSKYWLEFVVEQAQEKVTVRARLWDDMPPSW
jgi:hypothetical protein